MRCKLLIAMILLQSSLATESASAQETGFIRHDFVDDAGSHGYFVYVPENYDPSRQWPVMLFLHGAGERGHDPLKTISVGMGPVIKHWGEPFPFIVVFPQCEDTECRVTQGWLAGTPDAERALKVFDQVRQTYRTDPRCCVLCGWSMGAFGAWSLANDDPSRWTAVAPLSGGGDPEQVQNLKGMPIWAVHGENDLIVLPEHSQHICDAAEKAGALVHHTFIEACAHDVWLRLIGNTTYIAWMLDPDGVDPVTAVWADEDPEIDLNLPFRTAIVAPRAVSLRVGNDALRLIGYGAPQAVDADLLQGEMEDVEQSFTALDQQFTARLRGVRFQAEVEAVMLEGAGVDRLRARIGVSPLRITIDGVEAQGGGITASSSATEVVIGHRYPAWLELELRPQVIDGKLRFEEISSSFEFTQDNWFVGTPDSIRVTGTDLSERDAKSALVGGLYRQREAIRDEVLSAVPEFLRSLERSIDEALLEDYLVSVWPLPVYQPRVRLGFDSVWIDSQGISAVFDVQVAATDWERAPSVPLQWRSLGTDATAISRPSGLEVRIAAGVMEALAESMRETGVAQIHVLDIGEQEFAGFTDPMQMEACVPGIAGVANESAINSRIEMTAPFRIDSRATEQLIDGEQGNGTLPLVLHAPLVSIPVGIEGRPHDLAEFDVTFSQRMDLELQARDFCAPLLQVHWSPNVVVDATGRRLQEGPFASAPGGPPSFSISERDINADEFARQFATSWSSWMTSKPSPPAEVYDLAVGQTGLRCQSIGWDHEALIVRYSVPTTRLTNIGGQTLIIRTRGPSDPAWGERLSVAAGKSVLVETEPPLWVVALNGTGSQPVLLNVGSDHLLTLDGRELKVTLPEAE